MERTINALIIDDHPSIITAYKNYLLNYQKQQECYQFNITSALNADEAINSLVQSKTFFDLIFLDIRIPGSKNGKFKSGEDIGVYIKKNSSQSKIVVITGHYEIIVLSGLINNLNPDGLLYKSDVDSTIITKAMTNILMDIPYYSHTVLKIIRQKLSSDIYLDKIDKLLLQELYNGKKTKDLINCLPLSLGGIERRKRNLREQFEVEIKDDRLLVAAAIRKGFL